MRHILLLVTCLVFPRNAYVHSFSSHDGSKTETSRNRQKVRTKSNQVEERQERQQTRKGIKKVNFLQKLQTSCHTPNELFENVGQHLTTNNDGNGRVASLSMIRLSKMLISKSNAQYENAYKSQHDSLHNSQSQSIAFESEWVWTSHVKNKEALTRVGQVLTRAIQNTRRHSTEQEYSNDIDHLVEGVKAAGVISRILSQVRACDIGDFVFMDEHPEYRHVFRAIAYSCQKIPKEIVEGMDPNQLSGLVWALECLRLGDEQVEVPDGIRNAYDALALPFRIRPGFMATKTTSSSWSASISVKSELDMELDEKLELSLGNLMSQVDFLREEIRTTATGKVVQERRATAWQGDDHVAGFAYSGKVMETRPFSPVVNHIRNILYQQTNVCFDCCLLNLYPDGDSGMRYHSDPDQGILWGYDTSVVSVGASRRFSFREIDAGAATRPHNFLVMNGDITEMTGDCQLKYQHAVKPAEEKHEKAPRSSIVFKQSFTKKL